jgi:hypothetical protein
MNQARQQFERESPSGSRALAILLIIDQIRDGSHLQPIQLKTRALAHDPSQTSAGLRVQGATCRMKLSPVLRAQGYADRINFGKIVRVKGRRIDVTADPSPSP